MREWFEDEGFWETTFPYTFDEQKMARAPAEVDQVLALAGTTRGTVLDLCCGPGRHSIELAKRGFKVTGVDRTKYLLDKARERASAEGVTVDFVLEDMRTFVKPNSYDLVLSMFTSFGYFGDKDDDIKVLRNIMKTLKPYGKFVVDMKGKEALAKIFLPFSGQLMSDGTRLFESHEVSEDWSRVRTTWTFVKGPEAKNVEFLINVYSGQELKQLMRMAGFGNVVLFGNLAGAPYDDKATRLIAVGSKLI